MVNSLVQLKLTSSICSFFAIISTCYRLWLRRDRYWWDDACAFFSMLALCLQIVSVFLHLPDPRILSPTTNVAMYYLMAVTFYIVIWTARLSILYSVIRIDPNPISRKYLHYIGVLFMLIVSILISQLFWVCEPITAWKHAISPQCPLTKQVAIMQLVSDILADLLLVVAPLRLIRQMTAEDGTRRRLMIIFSTSIVTTIVSLVHAALILRTGGTKVVIAALVEDTISLTVCNLPVVTTALLRAAGKRIDHSTNRSKRSGQPESTFGWRVATRKTMETYLSDTAMGVTTINLRDMSVNNPAQTVVGRNERAYDLADAALGTTRPDPDAKTQQRSIVWLPTEKGGIRDEHDSADEESRYAK